MGPLAFDTTVVGFIAETTLHISRLSAMTAVVRGRFLVAWATWGTWGRELFHDTLESALAPLAVIQTHIGSVL